MLHLKTPRGLDAVVPETLAEDPSPRFPPPHTAPPNTLLEIKQYYDDNGYVIISSLFDNDTMDRLRNLWAAEVKSYSGFMYRQATSKAEKHVFNELGWVMNPILNLQSINPRAFPNFRKYATEEVLTSDSLSKAFKCLLQEDPKIVQSMYFEGNAATWEHQDSYYLDSEKIGEMAAAWIALEDIAADAGRFFICPKSNKIRLDDHSIENNIAEHHEKYILSVVEKIKQFGFDIRAPALKKGDVLFWNALTIHGSLNSQSTTHSRSSVTCHSIPQSRKFLQLQTRILDLNTEMIASTHLYRPKDLDKLKNKFIFFIESNFPRAFYWAKRAAVKIVIKSKLQ